MTVIGIGGLAFGGTIGEVGFAAEASYRNGSTVAAVVRITGFAFGRTGSVSFFASIGTGRFVGYKVTGIDTALADVGRTGGNKS